MRGTVTLIVWSVVALAVLAIGASALWVASATTQGTLPVAAAIPLVGALSLNVFLICHLIFTRALR